MFKNVTPKQIALYSSLIITIIFGLSIAIFKAIGSGWLVLILMLPLFFFCVYSIIVYALKEYIYRKIKLIYKNIHHHKLSQKDKEQMNLLDLNTDIVGEVEKDVNQWADEQNKKIESLKTLETYRREFLGNISHELKTPLFSIEGYIHTLLDGGLYDEKINRNYLSRAAKNAERLHAIVEDLESISRLESGTLEMNMEVFDIKQLTMEVLQDAEMIAKENKTNLLEKVDADASFKVKADREAIRQVLSNLVINSIKYGKKKGTTRVGYYDMDNYILVEVADDGVGIKEEHLSRLFDRFYRVEKSRTRGRGGSGLGLSIVKHIIEAHNQTINVRSTPDLGSTFGFTLEKVG